MNCTQNDDEFALLSHCHHWRSVFNVQNMHFFFGRVQRSGVVVLWTVSRTFAWYKCFTWHRAQRLPPEFQVRQQFVVCHPIRSIASCINEWIYHARSPCKNRSKYLNPRILIVVHGNVNQHERQKANQETDENYQHHGCEPGIFSIADPIRTTWFSGDGIVFVQLLALLSNDPVDAWVGSDNDNAWNEKSNDE